MKTKNAKILLPIVIAGLFIGSFAYANDDATSATNTDSGETSQSGIALPPEPLPPPPPPVSTGATSELKLYGKITANYKVTLKWATFVPTSSTLDGYKLTITSASGATKITSITADKTTVDDWNAKQNSVTKYVLTAIAEDGTTYDSNPVIIAMGPNGEADYSAGTPGNVPFPSVPPRYERHDGRTGSGTENGSGSTEPRHEPRYQSGATNHPSPPYYGSGFENLPKPPYYGSGMKLPEMGSGWTNPVKHYNNSDKKKETKRSAFTKKMKAALEAKIDTLSLDRLKVILAKIEYAVPKSKWILKAKLEELHDMVSNKIDELSSDTSDDSVVNDILWSSSSETK